MNGIIVIVISFTIFNLYTIITMSEWNKKRKSLISFKLHVERKQTRTFFASSF